MMTGLYTVIYFLLSAFFSLAGTLLCLRIALRYMQFSTLNPFCHIIYTLLQPILGVFDKHAPKSFNPRYDYVALLGFLTLTLLKFILFSFLLYGALISYYNLALLTLADFIIIPCNLLFFIILARVLVSWLQPLNQSFFMPVLMVLSNPALRLGKRFVPPISGLDFSPMFIMIALKCITIFTYNALPISLG
ncbi:MAG: YggT family protein [Legionellaceae bacterium]|nr:YggT family protein [Legionellaceae bacterium]